jgi:hypothetical protein
MAEDEGTGAARSCDLVSLGLVINDLIPRKGLTSGEPLFKPEVSE